MMTDSRATNEFWPLVAVAAVDILGVRAMVAKGDQCVTAANALGLLARNASARWVYRKEDLASPAKAMYGLDTYFGDSVYLFADPAEPIETQVYGLVVRLATLITIGLSTDTRVLLRGSVAIGDLRRRVVVSDGGAREIRIGTAMINAHELEQNQHWAGAVVARDAPLDAEARRWVLDYLPPAKGELAVLRDARAINWVAEGMSLGDVERRVADAVHAIGDSPDALAKLANTVTFIRHVHGEKCFPPMQWPR